MRISDWSSDVCSSDLRAFRSDEQVAQVVAGVVLAQGLQAVPDAAVGQHDLKAERQFTGIAVAQHGNAAGVGGEIAADGATAFGAEAERKEAAGFTGRRLYSGEDAAGLDRHGVTARVDLADAVAPAEVGKAHVGTPVTTSH